MRGIVVIVRHAIWRNIGRRRDAPVPMRLRHRRDWSRWGRYCICGLRWACPDRDGSPLDERFGPANRSKVWDRAAADRRSGNAALGGPAYRSAGTKARQARARQAAAR